MNSCRRRRDESVAHLDALPALRLFQGRQRAAMSTWNGDVWIVSGVEGDLAKLTWKRIASASFNRSG